MLSLDNRVALVTGGSRGIGSAICTALAKQGAHVVINYRSDEEAAIETQKTITQNKGSADIHQFDVEDFEASKAAIEEIIERLGKIDILVNNAGISVSTLIGSVTEQHYRDTIDINLGGAIFCTKAVVRSMRRQRWGRIINITSIAARKSAPGQAVYAASKNGLVGFTTALACELGAAGITVNCVSPGLVYTDMTKKNPESQFERYKEATYLKRIGTLEEVAAAVVFLASEEAGYTTGTTINVDGGYVF
jgi:3-oxoacyl-[acyl-carrier protein] reductase